MVRQEAVLEENITQVDEAKLEEERAEWDKHCQEFSAIKGYKFGDYDEKRKRRIFQHKNEIESRDSKLKNIGYWGDSTDVYFISTIDGNGYKTPLSETLYQSILQAIKKAPPANREWAKSATTSGVSGLFPGRKWSDPSRILEAARFALVDVRAIVEALVHDDGKRSCGTGSGDDGTIYVLRHVKHPIVKVGKTKSLPTGRAANYTQAHGDPDGWIVEHEVETRNVSQVEARIHQAMAEYRAAYGFNAREVFEVPVPLALKHVYAQVEL